MKDRGTVGNSGRFLDIISTASPVESWAWFRVVAGGFADCGGLCYEDERFQKALKVSRSFGMFLSQPVDLQAQCRGPGWMNPDERSQ